MDRSSYVYLLASKPYGTLYLGVTSDLIKRVWQHREKFVAGFTNKYAVDQLVWYEVHGDIMEAIKREKQLKEWRRAWKSNWCRSTTRTGAICLTISAGDAVYRYRRGPVRRFPA